MHFDFPTPKGSLQAIQKRKNGERIEIKGRWMSRGKKRLIFLKRPSRTEFFDTVFINPDIIIYDYFDLNLCLISRVLQRLECKHVCSENGSGNDVLCPWSETRRSGTRRYIAHTPPPPRKVKSVCKTNNFSRFCVRYLAIHLLSKKLFLNKIIAC